MYDFTMETPDNPETQTSSRFFAFLRHPLTVAVSSTLIFGSVVAWLGSNFQHRNWVQEHKIATRISLYEKIYDKRAEIVSDIFYNLAMREQNCWNIFSALVKGEDIRPHWYKVQEISAKQFALNEEVKIYFSDTKADNEKIIVVKLNEFHKIFHDIEYKIVRENFSEKGNVKEIEKYINKETIKAVKLTHDVQNILSPLIYQIDDKMKRMAEDIID